MTIWTLHSLRRVCDQRVVLIIYTRNGLDETVEVKERRQDGGARGQEETFLGPKYGPQIKFLRRGMFRRETDFLTAS